MATDRISAFDIVLSNGIPNKGRILNQLTVHWFSVLTAVIPNLRTHYITMDLPQKISNQSELKGRTMQVKQLKVFPVEAIVRGFLTGSAWSQYGKDGTVQEFTIPEGLRESEKLPEPLFTPSTKAPPGENDVNINYAEFESLVGDAKHAARIRELSLQLYGAAQKYAVEQGIIIADTKFEFGLDKKADEVVLIDEVLTPDSSRFWAAEEYEVGRAQRSFDKQHLRDFLTREGLKGKEGVEIPADVVQSTWDRYKDAYERLVGKKWDDDQATN